MERKEETGDVDSRSDQSTSKTERIQIIIKAVVQYLDVIAVKWEGALNERHVWVDTINNLLLLLNARSLITNGKDFKSIMANKREKNKTKRILDAFENLG